jgi:FPC/CPF motif-containing protein YcgG
MTDYGALVQIGKGDGSKTGPLSRIDGTPVQRLEKLIAGLFRGFAQNHPCIGARSVFVNGNMFFAILPDMRSTETALRVVELVEEYIHISDPIDDHVKTLAIVFFDTSGTQEEFAEKYWRFVQKVHDVDCILNEWDSSVSSDPTDSSFEFSIAGRAIFTTTLNPASARVARRFAYPVWVCNQTRQFNRLRELGLFAKWQDQIRAADAAVDPSGMPNPILTDHGYGTAAQQLAGSNVEPCPLVVRKSQEARAVVAATSIADMQLSNTPSETIDRFRIRVKRANINL